MAGSVAEEVLSSIKTVKAFGGHNKEAERFILIFNICLQVCLYVFHVIVYTAKF